MYMKFHIWQLSIHLINVYYSKCFELDLHVERPNILAEQLNIPNNIMDNASCLSSAQV